MAGKGHAISAPEKEIFVKTKHYFDKEKKKASNKKIYGSKSAVELTAATTGYSEISVRRILAEHNKGNGLTQGNRI